MTVLETSHQVMRKFVYTIRLKTTITPEVEGRTPKDHTLSRQREHITRMENKLIPSLLEVTTSLHDKRIM